MDVIETESKKLEASSYEQFTQNHSIYLDNIEKGLLLDPKMWKLIGKSISTMMQLAKSFCNTVDPTTVEVQDFQAVSFTFLRLFALTCGKGFGNNVKFIYRTLSGLMNSVGVIEQTQKVLTKLDFNRYYSLDGIT